MSWLPPAIIASLCGSLALTAVYWYLYARYKEEYMRLWVLSWGLYSLRYVVLLLLELVTKHPLLLFLNQSFALLSGLLLFAGAALFAGKRVNRLLYAGGTLGILWVAAGIAFKVSFLWLTMPIFLFLGSVYIWTGLLMYKSTLVESAPKKIVSIAFILWGLHKFNFPVLREVEWFAPWGYLLAACFGLVISLGILLIYYEELSEKLSSTKEWYESLFYGAAHGSSIAKANSGIIVSCNRKLADLLGYTMDEIVGRQQSFFQPECQNETVSESLGEHKGSCPGKIIETRIITKSGAPIDVEIRTTQLERDGETLCQSFFYDLSEIKRSEEIIRVNQERYRNIVENTEDLITRVDTNGVLLYVNSSALRIWGLPPEECLGKPAFSFIHPEDRNHTEESFREWLSSDQDYISFENRQLHVSGRSTTLLWTISATRSKQGEVLEFTGIARDIETLRREEKLQRALLDLTEASTHHDARELLVDFLKQAELLTESKIGFYHFYNEKTGDLTLQAWSEQTSEKYCNIDVQTHHYPISEAGVWVDAIRQRQPVVHNDYQSLSYKKGLPPGHAPVVREMLIPVFREQQIVAILGVGNKEIDYDETDIKVVQKLADLAWEIIVRKRTEEALIESEERFKALHEATFGGSIIHDKGLILECNQGLSEITGYSYEELIGMDGLKLIAPDSLDTVLANIASGYTERYEVEGLRKDGSAYPLSIRGKNITYKGRQVRVIEFRDITYIKEAEHKLRESEAKHKAMLENIHDVIVILGKDGNNRYISPNIKKWFGWEPGDLLDTDPWQRIHPDNIPGVKDSFTKIVEGETSQNTVEYRYQCKDGTYKWVECIATNCLSDPLINGILVSFRDISMRKKLQQEQRRSAQLAALGTVAAGVAHEINNPIQGILNYATLIEKHADSSERLRKASSRIVQESQRIATITKNLLSYSKDRRMELTHAKVEQIISDALSLISTKIRNSDILLNLDISPDLPDVYWQSQSIQQVILNLVDNSAQALAMKDNREEEKKITLIANLAEIEDQEYIRIIVQDNGLGMSQETIERAFEPFFTTKPSDMGTGLGLSIVNDIVSMHGGTLRIQSKEGQFTRVEIEIPVSARQATSAPA